MTRAGTADQPPRKKDTHGTVACHQISKCRCDDCAKAYTDYEHNRTRMMAYGRWEPLVDAEPVRAHLRQLWEGHGIGWFRVAELAAVPSWTVEGIVKGRAGVEPVRRTRPETAQALLAVTADTHAQSSALLASFSTTRRLRLLAAVGWPAPVLAPRIPLTPENVRLITRGERPTVTRATYNAVKAAYDALWDADPAAAGATNHARSIVQGMARRRGWGLPLMWSEESLEDPDGFPDFTGHCGTPSGWLLHHAAGEEPCPPCAPHSFTIEAGRGASRAIAELAAGGLVALADAGRTHAQVADLLGLTEHTIAYAHGVIRRENLEEAA